MANGRGDGGGEGDYDWLYGDSKGSRSRGGSAAGHGGDTDSEATQVMGRGGGRSAAGSARDDSPTRIAPTPGGSGPARPATQASSGGRKRFGGLRLVLLLLLAYVVFLVAVPVYAWTTVSKVDASPDGNRPEDQPGTNYLVVGSDARAGLEGGRTDTIMLLHTGDGPSLLMSIPRDSIVEIPGEGTTKINAAYAFGGPPLLVATVEQNTGIRVDHYVEMGFRGLVKLVDAVGGVEICPKSAIKDPQAELDIPKGCQEADGKTALGYARTRKTQQLGDIDRATNQREVVAAIGSEVLSWQTFVNPVRYFRTVTAGAESVTVGEDTGVVAAGRFALGITRPDRTCGVPIADLAVNWDPERAPQLFELIASDRTDEVTGELCRASGMAQ